MRTPVPAGHAMSSLLDHQGSAAVNRVTRMMRLQQQVSSASHEAVPWRRGVVVNSVGLIHQVNQHQEQLVMGDRLRTDIYYLGM